MNPWIIVIGAIAAIAAVGVITARHALYSALNLVVTICALSVLYLLLNAQFLFVVQIIVYAGAVMVLFIFIIALLNPSAEERPKFDWHINLGVFSAVLISGAVWIISGNGITHNQAGFRGEVVGKLQSPGAFDYTVHAVNAAGNIQTVAGQLFTTYLLPFEVTSLLLLVAAAGAVYLTRNYRRAG